MGKVRFREVNTVPAVIEKDIRHSLLFWKGRWSQTQASQFQNWKENTAWVVAPSAGQSRKNLGMKSYIRRVRNLLTTHSRALRAGRYPKVSEPPLMAQKDICSTNAPDLNVCDYWLFGVIEGESNVTSHPSVNSLKAAIRRAFRYLHPEDVKRSCSRLARGSLKSLRQRVVT